MNRLEPITTCELSHAASEIITCLTSIRSLTISSGMKINFDLFPELTCLEIRISPMYLPLECYDNSIQIPKIREFLVREDSDLMDANDMEHLNFILPRLEGLQFLDVPACHAVSLMTHVQCLSLRSRDPRPDFFSNLVNLQELHIRCGNTFVRTECFKNLTNLTALKLDSAKFHEPLPHLPILETLSVSFSVTDSALVGMTSLKRLIVSIAPLGPSEFHGNSLSTLSNLEELSIRGNSLDFDTQNLRKLTTLKKLNLFNIRLGKYENFRDLTELEYFRLTNCIIEGEEKLEGLQGSLPKLRTLKINLL